VADDLERACAQVGRFLYHFANLENQIDRAFAKLFDLSDNSANMITGSVDFYKRFNFVLTAVLDQTKDKKGQEQAERILNKVKQHNDDRQVIAHSRFEPAGDGVKFTRVVAREGSVKIPTPTWSKKEFEDRYAAMQKLEKQLERLVGKLKPAKTISLMAADFGTYALRVDPYQPRANLKAAIEANTAPAARMTVAKKSKR
jgi:hypothetical protein